MSKITDKAKDAKDKIVHKVSKRVEVPLRITDDNIGEHREKIIAKGRKFKYPAQFTRRRIVTGTIILLVVALVGFVGWLYVSLYKQQQTGDFFYSTTKILPLPVAKVDGDNVQYRDYLRILRANIQYLTMMDKQSLTSKDGIKEYNYHRRLNLTKAEKATYARSVANNYGISISDKEVDDAVKKEREALGATEDMLTNTLSTYYGWTLDDYKATLREQLLQKAVAFKVDTAAKEKIQTVEKRIKAGEDVATIIKDLGYQEYSGSTSAKTSNSDPSGVTEAVAKLKVGQWTSVIEVKTTDSEGGDIYYYCIARLDAKTGDNVDYTMVAVEVNKFNKDFQQLVDKGRIKEYISVPNDTKAEKK